MKSKRSYKDSVFRKLFSDKEKMLELFNAIEGTNYTNTEEITITTLEDVIFSGVKNDVSFRIGNEFIILNEHQSTLTPNMPLRFLIYVAEMYKKLTDVSMIYRNQQVKIPLPKMYTFYNGREKIEPERILKLSDAYEGTEKAGLPQLELTVKVFNINYDGQYEILKKCQTLQEYSYFIAETRKNRDEKGMKLEQAIEEAIKECVKRNILKEFLLRNGQEVFSMLNVEWNLDDALIVRGREEREAGIKEGIKEGKAEGLEKTAMNMLREHFDFSTIAKITGLTMDKVRELQQRLLKQERLL